MDADVVSLPSYDVETRGEIGVGAGHERPRRGDDPSLLRAAHGSFGATEAAPRASLDLDKHEGVSVPRDDVQFPSPGSPVPSHDGVPPTS